MSDQELIMEFPCEFPIKAMGKGGDDFVAHVVEIVSNHVDDLCDSAVTSRDSKGGKFQSVTVVVTATSRAQLDAIYMELTASERVVMAL